MKKPRIAETMTPPGRAHRRRDGEKVTVSIKKEQGRLTNEKRRDVGNERRGIDAKKFPGLLAGKGFGNAEKQESPQRKRRVPE